MRRIGWKRQVKNGLGQLRHLSFVGRELVARLGINDRTDVGGVVHRITQDEGIGGAGKLAVRFVLDAEMSQVVLPKLRPATRTDELWRHTCFEVFVALPDSDAYCELNFSPSTEWAMYGFVAYRRAMTSIEVRRPPRVALRPTQRGLVLTAVTYLADLPMPQPGSPLRAGAADIAARSSATRPIFREPKRSAKARSSS